jgi:2'-5' RNA ligase
MPPQVRSALAGLIERLRPVTRGVRWVRADGVHLTLRFLGEVEAHRLEAIVSAVRSGTAGHPPLRMRTDGLGTFPERGRPRVAWLGLVDEAGTLASLRDALERALERAGFARETRAFHPHLTLGRVRAGADPAAVLSRTPPPAPVPFEADEFVLMESEVGPQGARYTPHARFPLLEAV